MLALRHCDLTVPDKPGLLDIVAAVSDAIDARMPGEVHLQAFGPAPFGPVTRGAGDPLPALPGVPVIGHDAEALATRVGGVAAAPLLPLAPAIGRIALGRLGMAAPRPAPLYLQAPDAAPPREAPPAILPG